MDLSKGLIEYFRNPMSHSKQKYSKKYFKLMVLFSYLLMCDIEPNYTCASKYIKLTNKISRFMYQFKNYK